MIDLEGIPVIDYTKYTGNKSLNKNKGKLIAEYDLEGNLLGYWESIRQAAIRLEVSEQSIKLCLTGKTYTVKKLKKIFLWDDDSIEDRLEVMQKSKILHYNIVREYDLQGNFIRKWPNHKNLCRAYNMSPEHLKKCLEGKILSSRGRIFIQRATEDVMDRVSKIKKREKKRQEKEALRAAAEEVLKIDVYMSDGKYIGTYNRSSDAAKAVGVKTNDVNNHILGKAAVTKGYVFLPYGETIEERLNRIRNRKTWKTNL